MWRRMVAEHGKPGPAEQLADGLPCHSSVSKRKRKQRFKVAEPSRAESLCALSEQALGKETKELADMLHDDVKNVVANRGNAPAQKKENP